jgi:hypothetical protein
MYDWPEVRDEVDALWSAIGARLSDAGVDAPDALTRTDRFDDLWTHPGLLVGQACGLNVAEGLRGRVEVLGALGYDDAAISVLREAGVTGDWPVGIPRG